MKYIIKENKIESLMREYILQSFDVIDVDFTTKNVYLGSGPNEKGQSSITQKVINVYINNIKNEKKLSELKSIKSELWDVIKGLFGIDLDIYGSEWDLRVYQVKREEL